MSKTVGDDTTTYHYDALGNLRAATLPDGTTIEYLVDGRHRRVGKKVTGALAQGFLYQDKLRPVAELDGQGQLVARFVYATRLNVPDYMIKGGGTVSSPTTSAARAWWSTRRPARKGHFGRGVAAPEPPLRKSCNRSNLNELIGNGNNAQRRSTTTRFAHHRAPAPYLSIAPASALGRLCPARCCI
jgi:YD repeat-containing protein